MGEAFASIGLPNRICVLHFYHGIDRWVPHFNSYHPDDVCRAHQVRGKGTWVLWSASDEQRRVSVSSFHHEFHVLSDIVQANSEIPDDKLLQVAYGMLEMVNHLFAGIPITARQQSASPNSPEKAFSLLEKISVKNAFKVIEMELRFMYDILYPKAMVNYTHWGIVLWFISFVLPSIVLLIFSLAFHSTQKYPKVDLCITYCLR